MLVVVEAVGLEDEPRLQRVTEVIEGGGGFWVATQDLVCSDLQCTLGGCKGLFAMHSFVERCGGWYPSGSCCDPATVVLTRPGRACVWRVTVEVLVRVLLALPGFKVFVVVTRLMDDFGLMLGDPLGVDVFVSVMWVVVDTLRPGVNPGTYRRTDDGFQ